MQHTEGDYTNRQNRTPKHKNVIAAGSPPCFREGSGKNEDRPAQAQILETIISQPRRPFLSLGSGFRQRDARLTPRDFITSLRRFWQWQ